MSTADPRAILSTAVSVLRAPRQFFLTVKHEEGFREGLVFSVAMCFAYGVLSTLFTMFLGTIVPGILIVIATTLIGGLAGPFVGAFVLWAICLVFGSKATWKRAFPIAAYSMAALPISGVVLLFVVLLTFLSATLVPQLLLLSIGLSYLAPLVWLYQLWICYVGARVLMFEPAPGAPAAQKD